MSDWQLLKDPLYCDLCPCVLRSLSVWQLKVEVTRTNPFLFELLEIQGNYVKFPPVSVF